MDSRQVDMKVANLASKRKALYDQMNIRKEKMADLQEQVAKFEEQIQLIDQNIAKIKVRAEKEAGQEADSNQPDEVEESDGAITTGGLDASSQSTGGDYGGWRHYKKVGDTKTRKKTCKKKKCKKKNVYDFVDHVWDSNGDGE